MPVWQRNPAVLWRRSGSRTVMLVPDSEDVLVLDGPGSASWALLAGPVEESELVATLAQGFDTDIATVAEQLTPFLEELRAVRAAQRT